MEGIDRHNSDDGLMAILLADSTAMQISNEKPPFIWQFTVQQEEKGQILSLKFMKFNK